MTWLIDTAAKADVDADCLFPWKAPEFYKVSAKFDLASRVTPCWPFLSIGIFDDYSMMM